MPLNTTSIVYDSFTQGDRRLFSMIFKFWLELESNLIEKSKSGKEIPSWECHSIARLVHLAYPSTIVTDGRVVGFKRVEMFSAPEDSEGVLMPSFSAEFCIPRTTLKMFTCAHSWLKTPDGAIIDVYPCGIYAIGPIMVTADDVYGHFGANHYQELAEVRSQFDENKAWSTAKKLLEIAEVNYPVV